MKSVSLGSQSRNQRGYSLVELSVALAIVAVILVGALMGTRQVMLSNSVNAQVKDMAAVISKVQRHYAKQGSTNSANNNLLAPLGVWPSERASISSGVATVRGSISGSAEYIFSNDAAIGSLPVNGGFIYTLTGVQGQACADLVSALDPLAFAIYVAPKATSAPTTGATPSGTAVKAADAGSVDLAKLSEACQPGSNTGLDVAMVFRQ
jgi:prepilin-type N-terminal cleavage/methylation domain-containing protein